jgi:outer membrane lipoprotein-sorting protein
MKKYFSFIMMSLLCVGAYAESAKRILDKAAASVSNPGGVQAHFQMISKQFGSTEGQIAVKGNKFHATTPDATIWFDGKTQWTYMKGNDEVNISNPTEAQLQAINPYNFINIYKNGYSLSAKKVENFYEVHLVPKDKKRKIQEMYIIVDCNSYHPTHVKMKQKDKWSTIIISQLSTATLSDNLFQFNSKDFPKAEIIDLR